MPSRPLPATVRRTAPLAFALSCFAPLPAARAAEPPEPPRAATAASAIEALHFPAVTQTRLENGLTVILEENHASPFVAMQLRYAAGSRNDPPGKKGLAAVTQRMTRGATKHVGPGVYDATVDRIGGIDRGMGAGRDAITEWVTVPANAVDTQLWLWSDEMGFPAPGDPKALAEALAGIARERAEHLARAPLGALGEIVDGALYPEGHPYHVLSLAQSNEAITLGDVRAFHDAYFSPSIAILVLVGDFQPAPLLEKIKAYFGPIPPSPVRPAPLSPAQLDAEVRLDVVANVKTPEVRMDWRTPPFFDAGDAELDVAARTLAGKRISVLRWELVDSLHAATKVSVNQSSHALGSDFRISVTVADGHGPDEVIAGIDRVLALVRTRGLNDDAFTSARASTVVPFVHALDSVQRRANIYAELAMAHRDPTSVLGDVGRYDAVTNVRAKAAVNQWLPKGQRVVTVVTPDPKAPLAGALRATGGAK